MSDRSGHGDCIWPAMPRQIRNVGRIAQIKPLVRSRRYLQYHKLVEQAWAYFRDVQTKDIKYTALIGANDKPAIEFNREKMEKFLPELRKTYYDPKRYKTYLQQLGIQYPTVKK
jgi:hypothetical protein